MSAVLKVPPIGETYQGVHHRELPGVIQFQSRDTSAIGQDRGFGQLPELTAIDEGLQDVLLRVVIVVDNPRHFLAQRGQVLDILVHVVVIHAIGGGFGAQQAIVAHVLFAEAMPIMAADHRVGKIQVFDHSLELPLVFLGDLASEDHGDFLRLSDGAIHV